LDREVFVHFNSIFLQRSKYKKLYTGEYVSFNLVRAKDEKYDLEAADVRGAFNRYLRVDTEAELASERVQRRSQHSDGDNETQDQQQSRRRTQSNRGRSSQGGRGRGRGGGRGRGRGRGRGVGRGDRRPRRSEDSRRPEQNRNSVNIERDVEEPQFE
jgi:cold shock CspA family protein